MFRILLSIFILSASTCFADEQNVINLNCFKSEFRVQGKPFNMNEAGSSAVKRIYTFNNKTIESINLESYYQNLYDYLAQDSNNTFTLPLNIAKDGLAYYGGERQSGDTLYLSPSKFSREEYEEFTSCVYSYWEQIKSAFSNTKIKGSKFFGLFKSTADFGAHGIARIVYAEYPFKEISNQGWQILIIDKNNKVVIKTNFTANNPKQSIEIGRVEENKLIVKNKYSLNGQSLETKNILKSKGVSGYIISDKFKVEYIDN